MEFNFLITFLPSVLTVSAPIILASVGGVVNERSGVVNIGIEGLMSFGAFTAATVHVFLEFFLGNEISIFISLIASMFIGIFFSLIHAFAVINLKSNQIISGIGLNLLASGTTIFLAQLLFNQERTLPFQSGMKGVTFLKIYPSALLALITVIVVWYILNKRTFGLRLRSCGENAQAAAGAGINVKKMQYISTIIGGALAGLAGASLVLTQTIQYTGNLINGTGFIALAAISFGRKTVLGSTIASLLFGSAVTFALMMGSFNKINIPRELFLALPYIITVVSLVIFDSLLIKDKTQ